LNLGSPDYDCHCPHALETRSADTRLSTEDGVRGEQTVKSKEEWRDVAQSGQPACISCEAFGEWFPPGIDDARARLAARAFAEYNGMWLTHDEARKQVCLVLNNPE
jgi:hypothetical protein